MLSTYNRFKYLLVAIILFSGQAIIPYSFAANCQFDKGFKPEITNLSFGTLYVPRDKPIGTTIHEYRADELDNKGNVFYCDTRINTSWGYTAYKNADYNKDAIYESGVPGVGIRINTWGPGYGLDWLPRITNDPVSCDHSGHWYCGNTWGYLTIQLIKIAPTTGSGFVKSDQLIQARVNDRIVHTYRLGNTRIITKSCSLKDTNITVPMGDIKKSDFSGINSTAGGKDFEVILDCDDNVQIQLMLDGKKAKNRLNHVWALDQNYNRTTASGVGIQILYNNQPVIIHSQINIGNSYSGGKYSIPLRARYFQTDRNITPGQANATATMTLIYQ
ncbi:MULTISPECIES: fimbrial protein [Photorhabdus]|uniref:Fimbria adhesin protein n=1 Tax=Photorhabdus thracensis TaxID=230089 RepID=A0A0F7LTW0_9GAMM|nr:fimbrial protein [Photorhabdus thracensis]AKH65331.1 fimbria adhesin protein [Photorhabdus thracensis]MCC8421235.1 fimbrial protein [Photorhabdus thracensis]